MTSPSREAFEAWLRRTQVAPDMSRTINGYTNEATKLAWRVWRASASNTGAVCSDMIRAKAQNKKSNYLRTVLKRAANEVLDLSA